MAGKNSRLQTFTNENKRKQILYRRLLNLTCRTFVLLK